MSHITIIGSGIAAIAAALEAEAGGAQITIVRGRPGATALSSGAWDIAASPTRHAGRKWHESPPAKENLLEIISRNPFHPYKSISENIHCSHIDTCLERAIDRLSNQLNLRLRGSLQKNIALITPLGSVKITSYASASQYSGDLLSMQQARLLVAGFSGLPQFPAAQIAKLLQEIHDHQRVFYAAQISAVELKLTDLPVLSPLDLANRLDCEERIEELHHLLLHESERVNATHVALPPVIGIKKTDHILSRLREATGASWFETLPTVPSLPGLRLQNAIDKFLEKRRGTWTILDTDAAGAKFENQRIKSIYVKDKGHQEELSIDRLILATGRFVGGGIVKDKAFQEPLLDLPLFLKGRPVKEIFTGKITSDQFLSNHELFSVGVRTDKNLQPLNDRNEIIYENLWAAGSLMGGTNETVEHCGMGVAIGSGTLAGRMAL